MSQISEENSNPVLTPGTNTYLLPQNPRHKKIQEERSRKKNNHSLPSIGITNKFPTKEQQKVNTIRNQVDHTKNQITELKAKINALKKEKERNEKKKRQNEQEATFFQTIRDRVSNEKMYKQTVRQIREKEIQELHRQANSLREEMKHNSSTSRMKTFEKNYFAAEEERRKKKEDQEMLKRLKSLEVAENQERAKKVQKQEEEMAEKRKMFYESRVSFSKSNHKSRVDKTLSQRGKMERMLRKLKKEESSLFDECKRSQADMLESLYQIESHNPERVKYLKSTKSSRITSSIHD